MVSMKYNFFDKKMGRGLYFKFNLSSLSFFITLSLCCLVLYLSSIFDLKDYSSTIGFSNKIFDYSSFADGEFYKNSLDYYSNWDFLKNIGKNFVAGPVVPLIFTKLSFENLYVIFAIFSFMISLSVYSYVKIIDNYFKPSLLSYLVIFLIIFNPYNYYFVLKPGSEIPFQFLYSLFNLSLLKTFINYKLIVQDKLNKYLKMRTYFYLVFVILFLLILTRPSSLIIGYIIILLNTYLLIFRPNNIRFFKKDLLLINALLISIIVYGSFLYYEYANTAIQWLNSESNAIEKFGGITNKATYFGIPEVVVKNNLENYPIFIRIPFYISWKISSWILGICGIRDSFSFVNSQSNELINSRIWQVITRVTYGLFIYLPMLVGNLFFLILNPIKLYISKKISYENFYFLLISFISVGVIFPNMFLFNNERYIFMVFPSLLITFVYFVKSISIMERYF